MDSPKFGSQKPNHTKYHKNTQFTTEYSGLNSEDWYLSTKGNCNAVNSQISSSLKMAYTLLVIQKNVKFLLNKINKCFNKKISETFQKMTSIPQRPVFSQKDIKQGFVHQIQDLNNPQKRPFEIICLSKVNQKLQIMCKIINRYKLKKLSKAWRRFYINNQKKQMLSKDANFEPQSINLGLSSKIQQQKRLDSKKHARQMKQNSLLNNQSREKQLQNQKLAQQLMIEEQNLQKFSEQINNLLAYHQSRFVQSDRQTWLSQNGLSQSSYENKQTPGNKINKKR